MTNRLNDLTDKLNAAIDRVEMCLARQGLGVTAVVDIPGTDRSLRFCKQDQVWRLVVEFTPTGIIQGPLRNASRWIRCAAMHVLPKLYQALLTASEQGEIGVEEALRAATEFADSLP
jgi:hypothetical protein